MQGKWIFAGALALAPVSIAFAATLPMCGAGAPSGPSAEAQDTRTHRRFEKPIVHHPFGEAPPGDVWQFRMNLQVEADGRVSCYRAYASWWGNVFMDAPRQALLEAMSTWRYEPFLVDGKPSAVIVSEEFEEQEDPREHVSLPDVPLRDVEIHFSHGDCFGDCGDYEVTLRGDGSASYSAKWNSDVIGKHAYTVPVAEVEALVAAIRREDLWSMREIYRAKMSDLSLLRIDMRFGSQVRSVTDYGGSLVGMPAGVGRVEQEIERVGRVDEWRKLSPLAIDTLRREGFDFHSREAGEMLTRAIGRDDLRIEAVTRLIELGAPVDAPATKVMFQYSNPLSPTIYDGRMDLARLLIARGALDLHGKRSQQRVDEAFRRAIESGRMEAVDLIWSSHGSASPPSLVYDESWYDAKDRKHTRKSSVALLLPGKFNEPRDSLAIAKWLSARGVDLRARSAEGGTLLHPAAAAGDPEFVRYLIGIGVDLDARGPEGITALADAENEDVAMLLLEAGADPLPEDSEMYRYGNLRNTAEKLGWRRVLTWLAAHATHAK